MVQKSETILTVFSRQSSLKKVNIALALEAERLFHEVEVRIGVEKNRSRLKGAARYQNVRGGYDKASAPKLESMFASLSPKLVVRFKTLQGIKAAFEPSVLLLGLSERKNFKFNNAGCDSSILFEQ